MPLTDSVSTSSRFSAVTTRIAGGAWLTTGAASLGGEGRRRNAGKQRGGEQRRCDAHKETGLGGHCIHREKERI